MQNIIIIIAIIFFVVLCLNKQQEGYSSVTFGQGPQGNRFGAMDPYYLWRAYNHDLYNYEVLCKYPYNYKPKPYPERFKKFQPNFFKYGYGHY